jgi:dimethylsulfone monooxygenase
VWLQAIGEELDKLGAKSVDELEVSSMCWFAITDEPTDQTRNGKLTNLLVGTQEQVTSNLIELKQAGMTMPLIWPPFADVPTSKTLEDLRVLNDEILPAVNAA